MIKCMYVLSTWKWLESVTAFDNSYIGMQLMGACTDIIYDGGR